MPHQSTWSPGLNLALVLSSTLCGELAILTREENIWRNWKYKDVEPLPCNHLNHLSHCEHLQGFTAISWISLTNHLFTNTTQCIVLSCKSRVDHTHVYYFVLRTNNVLQTFGPLAVRSNVTQKDFYLCFIDDAKAFDQVEQDEIKQKC